jgi:profilin
MSGVASTWQMYVDDQLVATGDVCGAAIVGAGDGSVWAAKNLALKQGEGSALLALFKTAADVADSNAFFIGGVRYLTVRADAHAVYGKMSNCGVICAKTGHCVVVGRYDDDIQPGQAVVRVEKLADYLVQHGC